MRLNVNNYRAILTQKGFSDEFVQKATGLSKKTYSWILENSFIECETLERISDAIGCSVDEILQQDTMSYDENVIEWVKDKKTATLSLSQGRMITRVKKLAEKYPDDVEIISDNQGKVLYAHIPVSWVRINPSMKLTEEQKKKRAERFHKNIFNNE